MIKFLWNFAGGDHQILKMSNRASRNAFLLLGVVYLLINILIFVAFAGVFWRIFHNEFFSFFISLVLTFLVSTIYRLNLISLEPKTLPVIDSGSKLYLSNGIRMGIILAFGFLVSKCLEAMLFGDLVTPKLGPHHEKLAELEMDHSILHVMEKMHQNYPQIWLLTIVNIAVFFLPVLIKIRLHHKQEYYSLKSRVDKRLVLNNYQTFLYGKETMFKAVYQRYDDPEMQFVMPTEKFEDPPFNTKPILDPRTIKTSKDFADLADWN